MSVAARDRPPALPAAPPARRLSLVHAPCCVCGRDDVEPVGVGEDFEYRTSDDSFLAVRCRGCGLVYLDPRPAGSELGTIYPATYHAFDFSPEGYGLAYRVRERLERHRLRRHCAGLGPSARVLDVGCGDGFHLDLLRRSGGPGWRLEGVDADPRAVRAGAARGLTIHQGFLETLDLPGAAYDLVLLIATIEHVADPRLLLARVRELLRPGGRAVIVTDNTATADFALFKGRHWGGYHFPRHLNLFDARTLRTLAAGVSLEVETITTTFSPVNWTYSLHNLLVDIAAPGWLVRRFTLRSAGALAAFSLLDLLWQAAGRGALVTARLRRP